MVKKLYRHEFLALFRWILPIDAFCLLFSLLLRGAIELNDAMPDSVMTDVIVGLLTFAFIVSLIGMSIAAFWLVIVRFYKHLLSSEGYLTFTIPVSPTTHLVCKLVCGCAVSILSTLVTILGLWVILSAFDFGSMSELFAEAFGLAGISMHDIVTDRTVPRFIVLGITFIIMMIVSLLQGLLLPYAAMCVGQLSKKSKVGMAVLWYFIFNAAMNFVSQITNTIMSFAVVNDMNASVDTVTTIEDGVVQMLSGYQMLLTLPMLTAIVFTIAYFLVARYILNYKLNLE